MLLSSRLFLVLFCLINLTNVHAEIELKDLGLNQTEVALTPEQIKDQKTLEERHSKDRKSVV